MGKYDYADFSHEQFTTEPAADFGAEVRGSCFHQDAPNTDVFPTDLACTFFGCNIDNCVLPAGCTVDKSSVNLQHAVQNDGDRWILDTNGKAVSPLDPAAFDERGISKDPVDIPAIPLAKRRLAVADERAAAVREIARQKAEIVKLETDHGIPPEIAEVG